MGQDVVVEGEDLTIEQLFLREAPKMWRALVGFSGDVDIASDAVAEAFAQPLARASELRSPIRWIWRTAYLLASRELEARSRTSAQLPEGVERMPESVRDLVRALSELSPNQRASVLLHDYAGYLSREIAEVLGISSATVRVHISNGRRRLRQLLEDYRWSD